MQARIHLDHTFPKHPLVLPHLYPTFRRVTKHPGVHPEERVCSRSFFCQGDVGAEYGRPRTRVKQPCKKTREFELAFLVEKVEESRGVYD
jgi:hypothetical protein